MPSVDLTDIDVLRNMCLNKKQMSEAIANRVAKKWGQRAYWCPVCNKWHCTKMSPQDFVERIDR